MGNKERSPILREPKRLPIEELAAQGGPKLNVKRKLPAATAYSPAESWPRNEVTADSITVLWRLDKPIDPSAIGYALHVDGTRFRHHLYGDGLLWKLPTGSGSATSLKLFPERNSAKIGFTDSAAEEQTRELAVDCIAMRIRKGEKSLLLVSAQHNHCTIVNLHATGEVDQFDRIIPTASDLDPWELVTEINGDNPVDVLSRLQLRALTVQEAAQVIRCNPRSVKYLIAKGRLPAIKRGRQWLLDSTAVHRYQRSKRRLRG